MSSFGAYNTAMNTNATLTKWLTKSLPPALQDKLQIDIGVVHGDRSIEWNNITIEGTTERQCRVTLRADHVDVEINLERIPDHRTLVICTTLEGTTETPIEWKEFRPVRLDWDETRNLRVRTSRGGSSEKYYPPVSWTEETRVGNFESGVVHNSDVEIGSGKYGRSSSEYAPVMLSGVDEGGAVVAMEWSGLWNQRVQFSRETMQHHHDVTIPVDGLQLAKGETLTLPRTHLVFYEGSVDDGSNAFRRYVYDELCPTVSGEKPLPMPHYNHWFGYGNNISAQALKPQVDRAAELGLDYFILDAGWFPCGFPNGVGNWRVDEEKFPEGLEPFVKYVRSKDLKMGLWFDFERAHLESDAYQDHSEWFMTLNELPELPDKQHLSTSVPNDDFAHLDLSIDKARKWVVDMVSGWINDLKLNWVKFDYNIEPYSYWNQTDEMGKTMFGHVYGFYDVLDELLERHPDVVIENCASGGRRHDLGTLRRAHTSWISDQSENAHICRYFQSGANRFFPGNYLNSAVVQVSDSGYAFYPDAAANDLGQTDQEVLSRMLGTLCFMGDIAEWPRKTVDRVAELIKWYREWRPLLTENFYALTPSPRQTDQPEVVQFAETDRSRSLLLGFVAEGEAILTIHPHGLAEDSSYELSDPFGETSDIVTGETLQDDGITVTVTEDEPFVRTIIEQ